MKIGIIGLGKLGLPCAVAIAAKGHTVIGYDTNPEINSKVHPKLVLYSNELNEDCTESIDNMLENTTLKFVDSVDEIIYNSEIIFIAVQTPHKSVFEGSNVMPVEREDFDYTVLVNCFKELSTKIEKQSESKIVTIISTVLPGTLRKYILPITTSKIKLCYNPYFIAMGTVVYDFYNPEFILLGIIDKEAEAPVIEFYNTITKSQVFVTTLENAEMIKVSYNTFITTKIVLANNIMEMCHKLPNTNVDDVMMALKKADTRLISGAYLNGGMGDGGGCHPRDNIAMSWLSNKLNIQNNYYDFIMRKREAQTGFFVDIILEKQKSTGLDIVILGTAFKANTNLETGSPAILLKNLLENIHIQCETYDPYVNQGYKFELQKKIYFIGCKHDVFKTYDFKEGSVVIDPNRYIPLKDGVDIIHVGVGNQILQ